MTNESACNEGVVKPAKNLSELKLRIYYLLRDIKAYDIERVVVQGLPYLYGEKMIPRELE